MKKKTVLDLFCGAGGFSYGMEQAGFQVVAGIDNNDAALETYVKNHTNATAIKYDLSDVKDDLFQIIDEAKGPDSIDVLIGGPPCQGFSIAGKRLTDDPRNKLWMAYLKIIDKYLPKVIVLENVPTIINSNKGQVKEAIINSFSEHGYSTSVEVLLASHFGVPQRRKRAIFVATRNDIEPFQFPTPNKTEITTEEALSDLPLLESDLGAEVSSYVLPEQNEYQKEMRKKAPQLLNHSAVNHTQKTKDIVSLVPDGGNYKDLPEHLQGTRKVNIAWTRMNSKKPCFTIDAGHNHHFHYKANRVPTVRECARIQSFPDNFRFYGNRTSQYRQVGNAVPPKLGYVLANNILEVIDDKGHSI